jgi:predicted nucleic acid-binding protein
VGAVALPPVILDTSVLIGASGPGPDEPAAISAVSIAELHFGVLRARDDEQRAARVRRLGLIESRFPTPLPVDDLVAREWGSLMAAVVARGGQPRRRAADLAIAATARVHGATLLTANAKDFAIIDDLVAVEAL